MESPRQNLRGDYRDHKPPSPSTSPNSSMSSSNSSSNGGGTSPSPYPSPSPSLPPLTPKSTLNPNPNPVPGSNPYPTTFIQADTQSFKQVVQMLTGSAETTAKQSSNTNPNPNPVHKSPIPPLSKTNKKPTFKLYERRSSMKNLKMISPLIPSFIPSNPNSPASYSPRNKQPEILSPSILDFPKLVLSPVTPLSPDPFNRSPPITAAVTAEDRAIAEKGFYLHPSPRSVAEPPKLLPLFPLTSPRMDSSSSSSTSAKAAAEIN